MDRQTGLAHSAVVTVTNAHDKTPIPDLLDGNERHIYCNSAYASQKELIHSKAPMAKDFTNERFRYRSSEVDEFKRAKNATRAFTALALANIFMSRKRLMA